MSTVRVFYAIYAIFHLFDFPIRTRSSKSHTPSSGPRSFPIRSLAWLTGSLTISCFCIFLSGCGVLSRNGSLETKVTSEATSNTPTQITLDGSNHCTNGGRNVSSVSCTLSSVTAGDLITVEFSDRNGYETSISDGANGAYTKIYYVQDSADPNYSGMAYFMNSASGSLTVKVSVSGSDPWARLSVQAWKGASTTSVLDTGAITQHLTSTSGTVANANCGSAQSPAGAGELIIGYLVPDNNFSVTAGTNYTLIDTSNSNGNPVFPEYWIQSAATATNGPFTSAADDFTEGCAAFKPAPSSTQIKLDGSNHCTNGGRNVSSVSCTLSSVTAGDLITVEFSDRNGYETSISDGANGAYTKIYYVQDSADPNYSGMAYFMNSASGSLTVKVSVSGSDPWARLSVQAWKGASTTSVLDTGAITQHLTSTSGTVANANCGSAQSPAGAGELIIGYLVPDNDFSVTAGTNYTLIDVPSASFGNPSFPEYRIQTISQATNGPFTSAADDWTVGCAAFKAMASQSGGTSGPVLTINAQSVSFGSVAVNGSAAQSIVFTSSGSTPVKVNALTVSGSGFTISGMSSPVTLNPGQTATLIVEFLPAIVGPTTGQLTVTSDSSTNPTLNVPLSGTGQAHQFNLTWDAPQGSSLPIVGYKIYRSTSGNAQYQLLNPSVIAQTSFTDSSVQSGMTYQYYVTAVDSSGAQSSPSNIAEVEIP